MDDAQARRRDLRVAAFGDSLTNGDATANWPRFPLRVEPNLRCRLSVSKTCRGHYPRVLAALAALEEGWPN